jgi:hypothetical protein
MSIEPKEWIGWRPNAGHMTNAQLRLPTFFPSHCHGGIRCVITRKSIFMSMWICISIPIPLSLSTALDILPDASV